MLVSLFCVDHASAQATTPTVAAAAITSSPGADNTYALGDTITVSVTFSEAVTITGSPYVTLDIGGQPRNAAYSSAGAATGQMLFGYTVRLGDRDTDGITALANSLTLPSYRHSRRYWRRRFHLPQGESAEATAFWPALPARMAPQTHRTRPVNGGWERCDKCFSIVC